MTTTDSQTVHGAATIGSLRAELRRDALGVAAAAPRLSWQVVTDGRDWRQAAYQVELAKGARRWLTGRIESAESVLIAWPFHPLLSRERVAVRVRVWDRDGGATPWSEPLAVELGLSQPGDWLARFVTPAWDEDLSAPQPCPYLRRDFDVGADVTCARLYVTALGVYEPYLNGEAVGDHVLAPGWTSYDRRLRVQTFDVTDRLRPGLNTIGAILGDGWYRGRLGPNGGRRNIYGDRLALLAQLEISLADGTTTVIGTDSTWRAATGPILASDLYDGETYDARLELAGWAEPGFDDRAWHGVRELDRDLSTLVPPTGPPVRRVELVDPVSIAPSASGKLLVDFGQNLVGRLRIRLSGTSGQTVTLRHAEILEGGELCVRPLRQAAATDRYVLRGDAEEVWEPRFTFHGFRYAELDGCPNVGPADVQAVVCHSDLARTGGFDCSDPLVNRLHENVIWSMRGNFLDVPTDCAQRDERLGWTGDVQIFAPTALFLHDTAGFLGSWLADLAVEQDADGRVPNVVPEVLDGLLLGSSNHAAPAAAWGDAAVIVPWTIYERTGDRGVLAAQYESMCSWVDLVARLAGPTRLWDRGFQYGDWLDPTAPPDAPNRGQTAPELVATAYFAHSAYLLARTAEILGRADDASRYLQLRAEVGAAFQIAYLTEDGLLSSDSTTAYALALRFHLIEDPKHRRLAGERLAQLVREGGFRINTGFVGTPLICDALCAAGAQDVAYRLLLEQDCPSWLYPLTMGATTIWERWDSLLPDGSVNPGEMTSFNHYAFGAVADWLHRSVAGLAPAEPGYRRLEIKPLVGGGLSHAQAWHETPYGRAEAGWRLVAGAVEVEIVVPPNTVATVTLPEAGSEPIEVGSGRHRWRLARPAPEGAAEPVASTTA